VERVDKTTPEGVEVEDLDDLLVRVTSPAKKRKKRDVMTDKSYSRMVQKEMAPAVG